MCEFRGVVSERVTMHETHTESVRVESSAFNHSCAFFPPPPCPYIVYSVYYGGGTQNKTIKNGGLLVLK